MLAQLQELPPPAPGFTRVVRGELVEEPDAAVGSYRWDVGNSGRNVDWGNLPCPWDDQMDLPDSWRHMNCAAWEHTLEEWWPAWARSALREQGLRFVALDVPNDHIIRGQKQALIDRNAAVLVAEIH